MMLPILSCQGSGNNFILINEYDNILFSEERRITLSKELCEQEHLDGLLFFHNSDTADGKMRMFNPDGSEAEMCGNGLRCVGRFACETLDKTSVLIETLKSVSLISKEKNIYKTVETYRAELKDIVLNTQEINQAIDDVSSTLNFTVVNMPNPHLVSFVDKVDEEQLVALGKKVNTMPHLFPNGINVNFCQILDEGVIFVRTYERGVGLTQSCGSGMSASSLVYCLLGYQAMGHTLEVYNLGGLVQCTPMVTALHQYSVFLSGNATFMFKGFIDKQLKLCDKIFVDEIQNYGKLLEQSENMLEGFH